MREESAKKAVSPHRSPLVIALVGGAILVLAILLIPQSPAVRQRSAHALRMARLINLKQLGLELLAYGDDYGEFPPVDQWCDLLADTYSKRTGKPAGEFRRSFGRPGLDKDAWGYVMNPLATRWSAPDVVLLFESDSGWNQSGGADLLKSIYDRGEGNSVSFVDGHVEFFKACRVSMGQLRWNAMVYDKSELRKPPVRNSRRPETPEEMEYWLKNMVWHHQFSQEEVQMATGLRSLAIETAQKICNVYSSTRPQRQADVPLLILPYPGGRHPRVGFLEGAIDPQRETKFSVFTQWDLNSYVVVDVPEAIWSNLGLTYLAHTHIDTIWTRQGIELPKLEWNRRADGSLDIERVLPNGIAFGVKAAPTREAVRMEMWLRNGTDQKLTDLRVQNCVMPKMAAGFNAQTNENKVFTNPYVACRSQDGQRWIITAWENCSRSWGNKDCPCFHSDPKFPDLEPGQEHRLHGWLSFFEGEDIQAEFARIEALGWRQD